MDNKVEIPDGDYVLTDGAAWVEVGPFAIRVFRTDEGVIVSVYKSGAEMEPEIAQCWATDAMAEEAGHQAGGF